MPHSIAELNSSNREAFAAALGHLFEHSPWVAADTWQRRPFRDAEHLHRQLCDTMRSALAERQLGLIRAHPDLAGRLAQLHQLTAESTREQANAGLDRLTAAEALEMEHLNKVYRAKFGFPFIICARLNAAATILAAMKSRLLNAPGAEHAAALAEIERIAWLRLQDTLSP